MQLTGFHHVTAITADAPGNHAFYTGVLGMRLVKKTVNQDDTAAYHLFYADGVAAPGSDLTFFDWPARPQRRGTGEVVRTGLRVAGPEVLLFWEDRLSRAGVPHGGITERDGRAVLDFEDPEGQRLSLIEDGGQGEGTPWDRSPVAADRQIRGLGSAILSVPSLQPTDRVLQEVFNMRLARRYQEQTDAEATTVHVYAMGDGDRPECELHVREEPGLPAAQQGAGAVHHIAFRTPDLDSYQAWADRLQRVRLPSSGPVDRFYFRSLYMREPNGILIEIATDGPGFATDEPLAQLGERLSLPPFLEERRAAIENKLKPLDTASHAG